MNSTAKTLLFFLIAACAATIAEAKNTFVLYDRFLNTPALCYRLDDGWGAMGFINWNIKGDTKFVMSTILYNPSKHYIYQDIGPYYVESVLYFPQILALYQNPMAFAQDLANKTNAGIVVPGLSNFTVTDAKWTQDVPQFTRMMAGAMKSPSNQVSVFGFEGHFECTYAGKECEAIFTMSLAVSMMPQIRPTVPAFGQVIKVNPRLLIAPKGRHQSALRECGAQLATGFYNNLWCIQRDRTFAALVQGTIIGRNEGFAGWMKTQEETSAMLDRVRKARSEQIREVKTVDNPLSPGDKIERPAFFEHAWINKGQDKMILSDQSLEPNVIRPLMEQGEWIPIE